MPRDMVQPDPEPSGMHPYFAAIGPFYDEQGAAHWLGNITPRELERRRDRHQVLAMQTLDGTWLFPAWQLTPDGHVLLPLLPALRALAGLDRWLAGAWLINGHPALDGQSPRQALSGGADPKWIATLALQDQNSMVS
ncbi:MAG TPA: hypothetical protein PLZ93_03900 [Nocardioides sp.]|uniref:hypothetical protein n=1 Tax=uncultured Nocardioides sp. TaxID=198441 RepID=UPI00261074DA|nr:hypothetical protein [uncultured Nocardioides sp.]HRD59507.1 hypothetical protein [Nocardioides sp.]HRI94735.1 hypothetical protein [Nocardioides sp.]HRK44627.1 hypothetical protein [Nocardioides sp.]